MRSIIDTEQWKGLFLDGVKLPKEFVVTNIINEIAPATSGILKEVPKKAGSYFFGTKKDVRKIEIELRLVANTYFQDIKYQIILSKWLQSAREGLVELVIGNDAFRKMKVFQNGEVQFERDGFDNIITIEFIAPDPYMRGLENVYTFPNVSDIYNIGYGGVEPTAPKIEFTLTKDIYELNVISHNDYILMGQSLSVDDNVTQTWNKNSIYSRCESLNGFSTPTSIYKGVISDVEPVINTYVFTVPKTNEGYNYGDLNTYGKSKWFGVAKEIIGTQSNIKDFRCKVLTRVYTDNKKPNANSCVQVELKNENNERFAIIQLKNNRNNHNLLYLYVYLMGRGGNMVKIVDSVQINKKYTKGNFYGNIILERKGKTYQVKVTDNKKKEKTIYSKRYVDSKNVFGVFSPKILTWALLRYQDHPVSYQSVNHIVLENLDGRPDEYVDVAEIIANEGDKIVIDNEAGKVYKNDMLWLENLSPFSQFLKFDKQQNGLSIFPYDCYKDLKVTVTDIYS